MAKTYLCAGNGAERVLGVVLESMLAEMKAAGRSPLLIYSGNPPFALEPFKVHQRDIVLRYFDRCGASRTPAIRFEDLVENIAEARKRRLFLSEEMSYSDIVLYCGEQIPAPHFDRADEIVLFVNNDASSPGWVYNALRRFSDRDPPKTARAVIVNAPGGEYAAVFFYLLKGELDTLLGFEYPLFFSGHVRVDQDLVNAALPLGRTISEVFPGSRMHGEIKYVVRNIPREKGTDSKETFFKRLADSVGKKPGA